jgi:hypothetical protein
MLQGGHSRRCLSNARWIGFPGKAESGPAIISGQEALERLTAHA